MAEDKHDPRPEEGINKIPITRILGSVKTKPEKVDSGKPQVKTVFEKLTKPGEKVATQDKIN